MTKVKGSVGSQMYYIYGSLKISEILYINKNSRFIDNYTYIERHLDETYSIVIPATQVYFDIYSDKVPTIDDFILQPSFGAMGLEQDKEMIFLINQVYLFPLGDLILESVVPNGKESVARELINERMKQK